MSRPTPKLVRRARAIAKTMDRFGAKPFKIGANDCVKLARFHLTQLGHKLPSTGHYSTAAGAAAALKKQGARNIAELLDKFLDRIPPAAMLPGDLAMPPSEPGAPGAKLGTIVIKAGANKYIGWAGDFDMLVVMEISHIEAAWRA